MHRIVFLCLLTVLFGIVSFAGATKVAAKGCMNGGCHQELTKVKYMHGPVAAEMAGVNACEMCHVTTGAKCSSKKAGSYKLKGKGLCATCHASGTGTQHSAKEIESKCLNCHDPHGSDVSRHMLRASLK